MGTSIRGWNAIAAGQQDLVLGELNTDGNPPWAWRAGSVADETACAATVDGADRALPGGRYGAPLSLGGPTLMRHRARDAFLVSFGP